MSLSVKKTRKREFLEQVDKVVPRQAHIELIAPYDPEGKKGHPPFSLTTLLRAHFLQPLFILSDPREKDAFLDVTLYREFAQLQAFSRMPDEHTIFRFCHLLERYMLADQSLATVKDMLHGQKVNPYGDTGDQDIPKRPDPHSRVTWHVAMRPGQRWDWDKSHPIDQLKDKIEKAVAYLRSQVAHMFGVLKRQFADVKTRFRGLKKNTAQWVTLWPLSNS